MTFSRWGLPDTHFQSAPLEVGSYYWRVAALDKFGLPGERSEVWRFHVRSDVDAALSLDRRARRGRHPAPEPARGARRERARCLARAQRHGRSRSAPTAASRLSTSLQPGPNQLDLEGDRSRRQCHRALARLRLHAGRAGGGDLRRRPAAARPAPLRDRTRRDVDHRPHQPRRADPGPRRRRRRARFRLRRRRGAVRRQRAAASRDRGVRAAGRSRPRASRARTGSRSRSTRPRRGSSSRPRRPPSPRSNGCRSGAGSTAASSSWSTAGRRS